MKLVVNEALNAVSEPFWITRPGSTTVEFDGLGRPNVALKVYPSEVLNEIEPVTISYELVEESYTKFRFVTLKVTAAATSCEVTVTLRAVRLPYVP